MMLLRLEKQHGRAGDIFFAIAENEGDFYPAEVCEISRTLALICAIATADPRTGGLMLCMMGLKIDEIKRQFAEPILEAAGRRDDDPERANLLEIANSAVAEAWIRASPPPSSETSDLPSKM
jgi:hypothetical protein